MKKVLILANSTVGLYSFRNELVLELLKKYDTTACVPDDTNEEILKSEGLKIIKTPINRRGMNPIQDIGLFFNYMKILKEIKPDVVLTYTIKPNVYGGFACGLRRIPFLANVTGLGTALENPGLVQKIAILLYRIGLSKANTVFVQNASNQTFVESKRISKVKTTLLPGSGVNTEKFAKLPWPDTNEFVFISRIMKAKGIDEYLACAKAIREELPETVFHVVGPYEENYKDIIEEYHNAGIINYHGSVKDVRPFLEKVKCIIHPSYNEGMSNVCLEAAASGRAIITSDCPGCRETVQDGVTGFAVPRQDKEQVIEAVRKFLSLSAQEQKHMGDAGREYVVNNFDRNIVIREYMDRIDKLTK